MSVDKFLEDKKRMSNILAEVMAEKFRGHEYNISYQQYDGNYYHNQIKNRQWKDVIKQHIEHEVTVGIYPLMQNGRVCTMAIDIDDHEGKYTEFDFIQDMVLPVIHWFIKYGVPAECILVESSGKGYHLWFWVNPWVPAKSAVNFLEEAKNEFKVEIFPPNPKPNKIGSLIRLPLGVHRVRYAYKSPDAYSFLCRFSNGMIEKITDIGETIEALYKWKSLSPDDVNKVIADSKNKMFSESAVYSTDQTLATLRDNQKRACIKRLLMYPTVDGCRNDVAYHLTIYMKNVLCMTSDDIWRFMRAWNNCLTIPQLTSKELSDNVTHGLESPYRIGCRNRILSSVCMEYKLSCCCEFAKVQGRLPITDKKHFVYLSKGKSCLHKAELALHILYHSIGEHPLRGDGWFRLSWEELSKQSGIKVATLQNKRTAGLYRGQKPLDVLKQQGVLDYESAQGSKHLWVKMLKRKQGSSGDKNREVSD